MRVNAEVKANTRRALLEAAARSFADGGYGGANIDRVSEDAGLAKGTVYNYFPSKQAIFEAVLLQGCTLATEAVSAVPDTAPVRDLLEAFVAGNLAWAKDNGALAVLIAKELIGGDTQTRELILGASSGCVEKLTDILAAGEKRGELQLDGPPQALALTFLLLANTLLLQASRGGWPTMESLPTAVAGLFLDGAGGHRGQRGPRPRRPRARPARLSPGSP
jgi:AcrR family transcriptional regulator